MAGDRILVTGAAGFAGSHLLDLLSSPSNDGDDSIVRTKATEPPTIVAWCRPGGQKPRTLPGVEWRAVDLLDRQGVVDALDGARPGIVYHCAGAAHVGRSWQTTSTTYRVNVLATHLLLDALRRTGLKARIVITGSAAVYAPSDAAMDEAHRLAPSSPYAVSKLAQELVALDGTASGDVVVARSFNHIGPRQDPAFVASGFARRIADIEAGRWAPEISVGNLDAQRDLTDVRDTVRAYVLMAQRGRPGQVYNVCSGRAIAVRSLLDLLLARAKVPIVVKTDPARYRPNDQPIVLGNPTRIRTDLGWTARIPLEKTLDDLLAFWRAASA